MDKYISQDDAIKDPASTKTVISNGEFAVTEAIHLLISKLEQLRTKKW